ncbi:hypothetical protein [Parasphingorhabdus sp.]|uniref:hypothetical protein n=1 Tax=Parasphingorhabdus sp. TaxID=2709688 RepID=UPI003A8F6CAC
MKKLPALLAIISVTTSGCAMQQGDFPSLQKRPYEDDPVITDTTAPGDTISELPADVHSKLNAAITQSGAAHEKFQSRLPVVKKRVDAARGAAVSTESWVVAQMELAALEMERSASVEALADIDALYMAQLERETDSGQSGGATMIAGRREAVKAQVDSQQAEIDSMKNRLR